MPGAERSIAALAFENDVGFPSGPIAATVSTWGRLAGNSSGLPLRELVPGRGDRDGAGLDRLRDLLRLGAAARRRAVAHVDHRGAGPDGAGDRARGVRAEDLLPVRQRHVERPRPGPDAEHPDAVGGGGGDRRGRRAVEVRERPAAERGDVRPGDLRVGRVEDRVDERDQRARRRHRRCDGAADHEVAPARLRRQRVRRLGRPGDPVRLGEVEQPLRAEGGGERAGALAGDLPGAAGDPAGAGRAGDPVADRAVAARGDDPRRRVGVDARPRRPCPAASRPGRAPCRRARRPRPWGPGPVPRAPRAPRAGSVGSPAPG